MSLVFILVHKLSSVILETNSTRIPEKSKDRTNKTQARQFNQNAILKKKRMMALRVVSWIVHCDRSKMNFKMPAQVITPALPQFF